MSLEENKNRQVNSHGHAKEIPDAVRQKLNEAMSSYFFEGPGSDASQEKRSLLEIVKEGLDENSNSCEKTGGPLKEGIPVQGTPCQEDRGESYVLDENTENIVHKHNEELFSSAFAEPEYQSVDVEIAEEEPPFMDEEAFRYAQAVKDALEASPGSGPAIEDLFSDDSCIPVTRVTEKDTSTIAGAEEMLHYEKKDDLSGTSARGKPASPAKEQLQQRSNTQARARSPEPADAKPEKTIDLKARHDKKQETAPGIKKSNIQKVIHEPPVSKKGIKEGTTLKKAAEKVPVHEIIFLYDKKHVEHNPASISLKTHENPDRLIKAMWYLEKNGIFRNGQCILMDDPVVADEEDLLRVHDASYIDFVRAYSAAGGGFLGDSTYMTAGSYEIAKLSAGAAIKAGCLVADGKYPYAFVMTRPPGHHASGSKYGGFCLFNNVAILARYLQEKKNVGKIMIIDWDAHAGDGTMDIFYEDPTVLFASLHRDPHGFYPRKGFSEETGNGPGRGYTVNVEMPVGAGDDEYSMAFEEVVIPLLKSFSPEFIICSCGFDAYYKEKNIGLSLTSNGFHRMTSMIRSLYPGNFVLLMEGGYHDFNGHLCHSVLSALLDQANPVDDALNMSSFKKNQQQQIQMDAQARVAELKKLIPMLM
ncbi:MAG: histone deacetylase [Methanosarcinaceae archaeon]|nr:histone deacetylase [Methanosarcinaceae archaeon]